MRLTRRDELSEDLEIRRLDDSDLLHVNGGGDHGGPVCPVCKSTEVIFDHKQHLITGCKKCGYKPVA